MSFSSFDFHQLSEVEVNGQIEQVCEQVYSEMQSQAMEAAMDSMDTMDTLPMPGCFRMRSHSYVRAIDQGCGEEEGEGGRPLLLLPSSPPRTSATTVRTIQSSTGREFFNFFFPYKGPLGENPTVLGFEPLC